MWHRRTNVPLRQAAPKPKRGKDVVAALIPAGPAGVVQFSNYEMPLDSRGVVGELEVIFAAVLTRAVVGAC